MREATGRLLRGNNLTILAVLKHQYVRRAPDARPPVSHAVRVAAQASEEPAMLATARVRPKAKVLGLKGSSVVRCLLSLQRKQRPLPG
jgi:hypothetical protein